MNLYEQKLIECLKNTEYRGLGEDYNNNLDFLVTILHREKERKIFFIGNGGSATIAIHMTADFMKNGGMKTVSMYDVATATCLSNDYGYEHVFSKQIERLAEPKDFLIAISSSGTSPNIIRAINSANEIGAKVISFTGFKPDNPARLKSDFSIYVPSLEYGMVESIHGLLLQEIVDKLMDLNKASDSSKPSGPDKNLAEENTCVEILEGERN